MNDTNIGKHNPIFRALEEIPVSSTYTVSPYIRTELLHETTRTATHGTKERNQHDKKRN
jgi:hypothetical protein